MLEVNIEGIKYPVLINRKPTNRHTYIRVKKDLTIYVTTNSFITDHKVSKILADNYNSVVKMLNEQKQKNSNNDTFYFLGKRYDIIYTDDNSVILGEEKVFIGRKVDIDKWYRNEAMYIFKAHLDNVYNNFTDTIPYPTLRIRKMTSRWGVCNYKKIVITLNSELIKRDLKYLDYVICHELSHLLEHNHSKAFWQIVEKNCPDYKILRKQMKEY